MTDHRQQAIRVDAEIDARLLAIIRSTRAGMRGSFTTEELQLEIARAVARALAASAPGCVVPAWMPIETAPPREEVVVFWIDRDGNERRDIEFWDEGVWCGWHDHAEHTEIIGGHGVPYTPPYTHWMRLGSPATPSVAEAGGTIKEDLIVDQAQEEADTRSSMDRMADLLTRTVNALRGDPGPLRRWSWHDLPERAAEALNARKEAQTENEDLKGRIARAGVEIRRDLLKQGWRPPEGGQ